MRSPQTVDTRRDEIERLFEVEYGARGEVLFRLSGVVVGAAMLFAYTGWMMVWLWPTGFLAAHAAHYRTLTGPGARPAPHHLRLAGFTFLAVMLGFLWLPAYLAGSGDPVLSFVGVMLVTAVIIYLVRRADRPLWVVGIQIGTVAATLGWIMLARLAPLSTSLPRLAVVVVTLVLIGYFAQALLTSRRMRLASEAAAERAAQEEKMAAIGQLAGGIAHDFNNVLTAIGGNLDLYSHLSDPRERDRAVADAHAATHRAAEVVRNLLIYARRAPVQQVRVETGACIIRMMALSKTLVPSRISLTLDIEDPETPVQVDESQFLAALVNVLVNAVDAIPESGRIGLGGARVVTNRTQHMIDGRDLLPGPYYRISFRDTGAGISERDLPKVIEPFYTTKPVGKGTGLGLSMILGFVRASGGGLQILSSPAGTEVTLYLPVSGTPPPAA